MKAVYDVRENSKLMPEQQRLAGVIYGNSRARAQPSTPEKTRMTAINQRLASLYTTFARTSWPTRRTTR